MSPESLRTEWWNFLLTVLVPREKSMGNLI